MNKPRTVTITPTPEIGTDAHDSAEAITARLIGQYAPAEDEFEVSVGSETLRFKALRDRAEYIRLRGRAIRFAKVKTSPNPEVNEYYQTDEQTKIFSYTLSEMSLVPKFKPEHLLEMAKKSVFLFEAIKDAYLLGIAGSQAEAEEEMLETAKNE
jgi:hypothetical protein